MNYHQFTLRVGKESVERVYIPTVRAATREEAERSLKRTQRKRIIGYHLARPTSELRAEAETAGLPWPIPPRRRRS